MSASARRRRATGATPLTAWAECRRLPAALLLLAAVLLGSACATLDYYSQSAAGQLEVMARRQPVDELINDPATDPQLRDRLQTVQAIRRFATEVLALPDNRSYTL